MVFQNPIISGFNPDPSVCRVGDDYYLATSSFEYFPGVPLYHSRDLVHFRQIGHCLTRESQLPLHGARSSGGIYAPTLRHHAGVFYLVTTNVTGGGNFVVTAQDPAGEWSEPIWIPEPKGGIDPSLLFDDDGKVYFTRQGGGERGAIFQAELDLEQGRLLEPVRQIWAGTGGTWPEGPHLYKIFGKYYLLIAEGGTGYEHCITVARAESPFGPFEPCPQNPILTHRDRSGHPIQATGHGDLVQAANGSWWLVFLGIRPTDGAHHHLGRETFLAPVEWSSEGWPIINAGRGVELEMTGEGLPPSVALPSAPLRDDFDAETLSLDWNYLRNPRLEDYALTARPGSLRLRARASSIDELASPSFVARRQRHFRCRGATRLCFEPEGAARAGLVLLANEGNHYDLVVERAGASRVVRLRTRVGGESQLLAELALAAGDVELCVQAHRHHYEFFAANAGGVLTSLCTAPTAALSSERVGGFTGVYFGLYASSGGAEDDRCADFDWFDYEPLTE